MHKNRPVDRNSYIGVEVTILINIDAYNIIAGIWLDFDLYLSEIGLVIIRGKAST
nr:hypothetical protein [Mucilaginibacter sp. X5P1]